MARYTSRRPRNLLPVQVQPSSAFIRQFLSLSRKRRRRVDASFRTIAEKYLDPDDARQIRACMKALLRFHDEQAGKDLLHPRRCKNPWCPWCAPWDHRVKTHYQARKLASLDPAAEPKLRLVNLVWEIPRPFHELVRCHEGVRKGWRTAIRRTIAGAYGYQGNRQGTAEENCWREMGAILKFHAFGDRGTPWPKWFPHYDMLLCGYVKEGTTFRKLRRTWPEPYAQTRARYRDELRRALLPPLARSSARSVELQAFLATDFDVVWHVTEVPKGTSNVIQTGARAYKTVAYSCRPLFSSTHAKLQKDTQGNDVLVVEPPSKRTEKIVHRVAPGPAFGALRAWRAWIFDEHANRHTGTLHNGPYTDNARLAGHEPVREREKTSLKLKSIYAQRPDGKYHELDPAEFRRGGV